MIRLLAIASLLLGSCLPAAADQPCTAGAHARVWNSPLRPVAEADLRFLAVATDGPPDALLLVADRGEPLELAGSLRGGPPWSLAAGLPEAAVGDYRVEARRDGQVIACSSVSVAPSATAHTAAVPRPGNWDETAEAFYSAWVERLFDAPPDAAVSFPSLEPVLRDSDHNFLYNYLGMNEDRNLPATPDCADLPYTLRAYFAWKVGLPVQFRPCSRGSAQAPPRCGAPLVKTDFLRGLPPPSAFAGLQAQMADTVHSGTARGALEDAATDLYPVELSRQALRPGTVFADPYGHVLVLAQWVPQTPQRPGMLLAVDAQPDNSVTRKRFWEGTFLFADLPSAGPGFKAFRPLSRSAAGSFRAANNAELDGDSGHAGYSEEQSGMAPEDFYARMGKLINPSGLEPRQAYDATLDALVEQLETRVTSVANGDAYFRKNPAATIAMPEGAAIFETIGPWEDFSTPSRDLRLIIAMNVLAGLPQQIVRHPELFLLNDQSPETARTELARLHASRIRERSIHYLRSDGSSWEISVAEILARKPAFELAYNPNDCPEHRWGADPGSEEYRSCRRHAPAAQRARMERYRDWFRTAQRPPR